VAKLSYILTNFKINTPSIWG